MTVWYVRSYHGFVKKEVRALYFTIKTNFLGVPQLFKLPYGWVISLWIMNNDYFFLFLEISLPLSPATWPRPDAAAAGGGHPPPADAAALGWVYPPRLMRRRAPAGGIHFENYVFKYVVCSYFVEKTGFPQTIPFVLPKIKVLLPKWPYGTWEEITFPGNILMLLEQRYQQHPRGGFPLFKWPCSWIVS